MKKILSVLVLLILTVTVYAAKNNSTIRYPGDVSEIKSAVYSSGGGNTSIIYVKVLCKRDDGSFVLYFATKKSAAGMFGMGRLAIPDKIEFVKDSKLKDKLVWQ